MRLRVVRTASESGRKDISHNDSSWERGRRRRSPRVLHNTSSATDRTTGMLPEEPQGNPNYSWPDAGTQMTFHLVPHWRHRSFFFLFRDSKRVTLFRRPTIARHSNVHRHPKPPAPCLVDGILTETRVSKSRLFSINLVLVPWPHFLFSRDAPCSLWAQSKFQTKLVKRKKEREGLISPSCGLSCFRYYTDNFVKNFCP